MLEFTNSIDVERCGKKQCENSQCAIKRETNLRAVLPCLLYACVYFFIEPVGIELSDFQIRQVARLRIEELRRQQEEVVA